MLQTIFHQIWNQRRQNAWIFLELLLVSFFLFTVIDPLYVLYSNRLIPSGYDTGRCYQVQIKPYHAKHPKFNPEMNADSLADLNYRRIGEVIARLPEVESYALVGSASIPNGNSWSGSQLYADTADVKQGKNDAARQGGVSVQIYNMVATSGCDMFRTYGIRDVRTDDILSFDANERDVKYISSYCARLLFGTTDVVGRTVYNDNKYAFRVGGVFHDLKNYAYQQPYPMYIDVYRDIVGNAYMCWQYKYIIKLKEGVDVPAFRHRMEREVAPQLAVGNFYYDELIPFSLLAEAKAEGSGLNNILRLKTSLAAFALLCIFLGMVGTFWIRCEARRQEIGLMCSFGASRATIVRQFLIEAWMLVTLATLLMLPALLFQYQDGGFYVVEGKGTFVPDLQYPQNRFAPHFFTVWGIGYLFTLAVSLVATFIPTWRAAKTLPAEALRDE